MEHLPRVLARDVPQEQEEAAEAEVEVEELLLLVRAQKQGQDDLHLGLREVVVEEEATMEIVRRTS